MKKQASGAVSAGGTASSQLYEASSASLQGVFSVCYCPSVGGCDDDADFTHRAGGLEARAGCSQRCSPPEGSLRV